MEKANGPGMRVASRKPTASKETSVLELQRMILLMTHELGREARVPYENGSLDGRLDFSLLRT